VSECEKEEIAIEIASKPIEIGSMTGAGAAKELLLIDQKLSSCFLSAAAA
jgi:hypothetical protein